MTLGADLSGAAPDGDARVGPDTDADSAYTEDTDAENDDGDASASTSGTFSDSSRDAAIRDALELVVSYRSSGSFGRVLVSSDGVTGTPGDKTHPLVTVAAGIALRLALGEGGLLDGILSRITTTPSFQYRVHRTLSAGTIRGRLDVRRYMLDKARVTAPRSYPVRSPVRDTTTPENLLAVICANSVLDTLRWTTTVLRLTQAHTDGRAARELASSIARHLSAPALRPLNNGPTLARYDPQMLASRVQGRIDTRRVLDGDRFSDLLSWAAVNRVVTSSTLGRAPVASHLDERFDTRLFELWLLKVMVASLTTRFGAPHRLILDRLHSTAEPVGVWRVGVSSLTLYYQAQLQVADEKAPIWGTGTHKLGGQPDLTIVLETAGTQTVMLLDAKLRQRVQGWPSPEIYKMLGYFGNLGIDANGLGAILYHAPNRSTRLEANFELTPRPGTGTGFLRAVGVDPTDNDHGSQVADELIETLWAAHARTLGAPTDLFAFDTDAASGNEAPAEAVADAQQRLAAETLLALEATRTEAAHFEGQLRDLTSGTIETVEPRIRRMLASGLLFGQTGSNDFEISGAVLAVCNAVEHIVRGRLTGIELPSMLGPLIAHIDRLVSPRTDADRDMAVGLPVTRRDALDAVRVDLRTLKDGYRNPCAHEGDTDVQTWMTFFDFVFVGPHSLLNRVLAV